jgi:outer membrane protein assembly factor BamA
MTKVEVYCHKWLMVLFVSCFLFPMSMLAQFNLHIYPVDKDSTFIVEKLKLQTNFKNWLLCAAYINKLPTLLQSKGYPGASVDSVKYDSLQASIHLYVGETYSLERLNTDSVDKRILDVIAWSRKDSSRQHPDLQQVQAAEQKILDYLENNGYPFAKVALDSIIWHEDQINARLKVEKGPLYKIDSIRNMGNAKISTDFLQRYLNLPNGSIYRKEKLQSISKKLNELPYVQEKQPWSLTLLGTGSILNVYLAPKKSSQINILVGFLPPDSLSTTNKLQITGEATINLKNSLGNGETIGLNWQQLQPKSPRLDIVFQQPYLFKSPFGVNFNFDLFKKDSSYLNLNMVLGTQYTVSSDQWGSIYFQDAKTSILNVDTLTVMASHRLPDIADINSLSIGLSYNFYNTDYRYNPRKGTEFQFDAAIGTKQIKKNSVIVKLHDPNDPDFDFNSLYDTVKLNSYQFRIKAIAAQYFKLSRVTTLRLSFNGGWFQSPQIFRNELFQIGGYKLLRGFDEESIFASQYAVGSTEYRYLVGRNSYMFAFLDYGWAANTSQSQKVSDTFLGTGIGMAFETKAGIFNISYAVGKRDDTKLNLRESKIHIGYVNFF